MVQIFIIFLIIILVFAAVIGIAVMMRSRKDSNLLDNQYYDESGNHLYYDRSRIEKDEFLRRNPNEKPRSLSRLFSKRNLKG